MSKVSYQGKQYEIEDGVSVLDTLLDQGLPIPHGCKSGICQSCMMKATEGELPEASQLPLTETQREKHFFLACSCFPESDLSVVLPEDDEVVVYNTSVVSKDKLNDSVIRLRLSMPADFQYKAGQFINIIKDAENQRSYSLASVPGKEDFLELQIKVIENGIVSSWIEQQVNIGDEIKISESHGDCYYSVADQNQNILLIGTGTGLAPLYGVVRDALSQGHTGKISLYHGASQSDDLYLVDELKFIDKTHENFTYVPCVSQGEPEEGEIAGRANDIALQQHPSLKGYKIFLCGNPNMVDAARKKAFLAGAGFNDILVDAFKFAHS